MPRHAECRILPYTPAQMFDLVAGIEHYPAFLPWCLEARVLKRRGNDLTEDLVIGYKKFRETFTSAVTLEPKRAISVSYAGGPLTHLSNEWKFAAQGKKACALSFEVDFGVRSRLLGGLMEMFFDQAFNKMVAAFEARAKELYD